MKVYYVFCAQGDGKHAVCSTMEKAKQWLMDAIIEHQAVEGEEEDPDPWNGWAWWANSQGNTCFGGDDPPEDRVAEGYIEEMEVI